jgi:hypothetical protein
MNKESIVENCSRALLLAVVLLPGLWTLQLSLRAGGDGFVTVIIPNTLLRAWPGQMFMRL